MLILYLSKIYEYEKILLRTHVVCNKCFLREEKSNTTKNENSQSNAFKKGLNAQTYSTKQAAVNQIHRENAGKKSSSNTDCKIRDHSHSHGRCL